MGNIIISVALVIATVLVIKKLVKDRKSGKGCCGGECGGCAMSGVCHNSHYTGQVENHDR